ncbi:MAG: methyltransferase [Rhodospirillaceae bacterium]|nr:MAG: methyltransferase [Rhodospirillaceae bacterium]
MLVLKKKGQTFTQVLSRGTLILNIKVWSFLMTIGFRILERKKKVALNIAKEFLTLPVANVSDSMWRLTAGGSRLRPMHKSGQMAGPALTVKSRPGDNLMLHKAIDMAEPGDIIVCDAGGDLTNSLMGELMLAHAMKRGVGGFVLDGAVRDVEAFLDVNLPVFAAGVSHRGPYKDGPGEINVSVAIDGMVIEPGDLVIGDWDGVLSIPLDDVESILKKTNEKQAAEAVDMAKIEAGEWDRSWVDKTLKDRGCIMP